MLLVIFGAGASYDSYSALPPAKGAMEYRPPLANQLFDRRFGQFISSFPDSHAIASRLQNTGADVETVLETMQNQAKTYPRREIQLAAVRYYLQTMLHHTLARWEGITFGLSNYKTLLDQINQRRSRDENVLVVSFNYDTLLEDALPTIGIRINSIDDYTSSNYKIIKLHGSINWARVVKNPNIVADPASGVDIVNELIQHATELEFTPYYRLTRQYPTVRSENAPWLPLFPALAIPVRTKQHYPCPDEHVKELSENLPQVTKMLTIGWRAADKTFVDTLAAIIGKGVRGMVVSSNAQSANEIIKTLREARVPADLSPATGGFSDTILNGEADNFLRS